MRSLLKLTILFLLFSSTLHGKENTYSNLSGPAVPREYVLFESDPVRPLAISHDGEFLFVTNVPDSHVEVYAIHDFGLTHYQSIPVGLEPVAVAVSADDKELWVVNHLSDSVSVVDISSHPFHVKQTLLVGDEPRDIVFAGENRDKAFITAAHRGQNLPFDPKLFTPGVGRADVWVFQQDSEKSVERINIISLFGDSPRPLAVSNDGSRVYAGVFKSGNQTTTLPPEAIRGINKPPPLISADGIYQPETGLIVKFNGIHWLDELNRSYNHLVRLNLPDYDVFEIDANLSQPVEVNSVSSVGTILFNMQVHPQSGVLLVSNLNSKNHVRFEGRPIGDRSTVRGQLADHQISLIANEEVKQRNLNKHLTSENDTGSEQERNISLSQPMQMVFDESGENLFVAAFGSNKIARYKYQELLDDSFLPANVNHLELTGGGPAGIVHDAQNDRLYAYTRYDNGISIIDEGSFTESGHLLMHNPEPDSIREGRPFLYDARKTSGFGNDSCATCHVFGNNDGLAWDLGNPDGEVLPIPNSYHPISIGSPHLSRQFHPMKGPMTTQSMRGLVRHGPQHWRGDRTGVLAIENETLEEAAFKEFNAAFEGLMAKESGLSEEDLQKLTDFSMQLTYPPNPNRNIDNSLTDEQLAGKDMYDNGVLRSDGNLEVCAACHPIDPANGIYGTTGQMSDNSQPGERDFKIPHFRDQYQKIGMFTSGTLNPQNQVRGFAFNHNGATSNNSLFLEFGISSAKVRQLKDFLYSFPTETAPIVGQQLSINKNNYLSQLNRLDTFINRAQINYPIPECDLTASQIESAQIRNWSFDRGRSVFEEDISDSEMTVDDFKHHAQEAEGVITLTCQPWGSGERLALDRDEDGIKNRDEVLQGSLPNQSESIEFKPLKGLWFDPNRLGSGYDIEIKGDQMTMVWYTYREDGSPLWYLASGEVSQNWVADLKEYQWNFDSEQATGEIVGNVQLQFNSSSEADLSWHIGDKTGLQRLKQFKFASQPDKLDLTALWYQPERSGWGISMNSQGDRRVVVSYYYDQNSQAVWSLSAMDNEVQTEFIEMKSYQGSCPWCEYQPSVITSASGQIGMKFTSIDGFELDYTQHDLNGELIWRQNSTPMRRFSD